jgi:hypothetical protein
VRIKSQARHTGQGFYPQPLPAYRAYQGEKDSIGGLTADRTASSSGRFGCVYVRTSDGIHLWSRTESRQGLCDSQLRGARKGLLGVDALGALVRHAERAADEFGVYAGERRVA